MLDHINLQNVLIIDIETVPFSDDFSKLDTEMKLLWEKKASWRMQSDDNIGDFYFDKSGIYAEFGKVICISCGFFRKRKGNTFDLRIRSFSSEDEKVLLAEFIDLLDTHYFNIKKHLLCGHNGKEFDFPYLARRMLINELTLPGLLDIAGKKPWEVPHLDTMQLWKFGDYKNFTSLQLLANIFNIPSPKKGIDGSDIARVYWKEKDLPRIVRYCQRDVVTVAQLLLKFKNMEILPDDQITIIGDNETP